jgi:hypothetical protein
MALTELSDPFQAACNLQPIIMTFSRPITIIAFGIAFGVANSAIAGTIDFAFEVQRLDKPSGADRFVGTSEYGNAVSSSGHVAGYADFRSGWRTRYRGVRWNDAGNATRLGLPAGASDSNNTIVFTHGVNASGQVVGSVRGSSGPELAVRWDADGNVVRLQNNAPGTSVDRSAVAYGITGDGTAVGAASFGGSLRAVRWNSNGNQTRLDDPAASLLQSRAFATSDAGWVAGDIILANGDFRAARWDANGTGTVLSGSSNDTAIAIANDGTAVGSIGLQAARWNSSGNTQLLETLSGVSTFKVEATGVVDGGLAVGYVNSGVFDEAAILWDEDGDAHRLDGLLTQEFAGYEFWTAFGLATDGNVLRTVVEGQDADGNEGLFLLSAAVTPIPSPAAAGGGLALLAVTALRRRTSAVSTSRSAG